MTADVLEKDLQRTVIEMAQVLGWRLAHFRPARTEQGWRTPVAGDGEGFPDIVLVRERIMYLELKREKTKVTPAQKLWLRALRDAVGEVYVIRPRDLDNLAAVLQANERQPSWSKVATLAECDLSAALDRELS